MNIGKPSLSLKTFKMLSVVIPCYNEEDNLKLILDEIDKILNKSEFNIEFILVNNGSTDNSKIILNKLIKSKEQVKVLNIENNIGYGHGIISGLNISRGDVLSWTHADLQTDLNDVISAYKKYLSSDNLNLIIKGKRKNRNIIDGFFTWGMQVYSSIVLKIKLNDINAQPKLFSKYFYLKFLNNPPLDFSLDLFLMYQAAVNGKVNTIDVVFKKRLYGFAKGGGSLKGKLKLIIRTLSYIKNLKQLLHEKTDKDFN